MRPKYNEGTVCSKQVITFPQNCTLLSSSNLLLYNCETFSHNASASVIIIIYEKNTK